MPSSSVVLFHTGYLPSGFIGVDMFLVISGFVVTRGLARALAPSREATAHVILGFYKKRVARLLPAVALVAGPGAVAALVLGPMSALFVSLKTVIAGLLLMSNGFRYRDSDYFSVGSEGNPFLHLWSLSVEEQFYLVFPFVLATAGLWRPSVSLRIKGLWVDTVPWLGGGPAGCWHGLSHRGRNPRGSPTNVGTPQRPPIGMARRYLLPVCAHGQCSSHSNGKLVYRDPTHLSIQGAEWVSPVFFDSLRGALR